jgi:hypothetical protein
MRSCHYKPISNRGDMVLIVRNLKDPHQTRGRLTVLNDDYWTAMFSCNTLELAWNDNKRNESCIPEGKYKASKHISPTFGLCIKIHNVPNRSDILIHAGNFYTDTKGCILVGKGYADINGDGIVDILHSRNTMDKLMEVLPFDFEIEIQYSNE